MFRKISTIVMLSLFFIGLSVLLYPAISTYWNTKTQSRAVENYEHLLESISREDYEQMFESAHAYNKALGEMTAPLFDYPALSDDYNATLNVAGNGMLGYISIDSIGVQLPIYHGTSDSVLAIAAGHMEGTSLPVGGKGTHAVLSAHRGLPSAKLFTDLDKLQLGDHFKITILDEVLLYEVDNIVVVTPDNAVELQIQKDKDYCTLLTCTPYGINSHRLLVRGQRVDAVSPKSAYIGAEAYQIDTLIVTPIVALPILLVLIVYVVLQPVKKENLIEGDDV